MKTLSYPVSSMYMYLLFIALCLLTLFNVGDIYIYIAAGLTILISSIIRGYDIYLTFADGSYQRDTTYWKLIQIFVSHVILFTSLFIILKNDYTIPTPTNTVVDAIYYTVDISSSVGTNNINPTTLYSKLAETINQLDTYLILITFGLYTIRTISNGKN